MTAEIRIVLEVPQPQTNYLEVTLTVAEHQAGFVDLVMPVWTPGSYLVREFARNVENFSAADSAGNPLAWQKISKNTWRITPGQIAGIVARYRVYAFEMSVRTSFVDADHAWINGAGVFMYVEGCVQSPYRLRILPPPEWATVSTGLERAQVDGWEFLASDYDTLVDCPIEIGNHEVLDFDVAEIPHSLAICGHGNEDRDRLVRDLRSMVLAASKIMGEIPYRRYTFLLHLCREGGGGLEHRSSASLQTSRWTFRPEESYRRFLRLAAHEHFHAWNVKRIRPVEIGPFDYTRENHTRMLWFSEGFTDYYADRILLRAGLITVPQYMELLIKTIQDFREVPGRLFQSAADASFDAWIKFYRQDPHSPNATISYYTKGHLIALLLDLEIRRRTGAGKSLDDLMRLLYERFCRESDRGFSERELREAAEEVAAGRLDEIFEEYVYGTKEMDFSSCLEGAGLRLVEANESPGDPPKGYLGISIRESNGRVLVTAVTRDGPGYVCGINVHDEILALNGFRASVDTMAQRIEEIRPDERVEMLISRDERILSIPVTLGTKPDMRLKIQVLGEANEQQRRVFTSWTNSPWPERSASPGGMKGAPVEGRPKGNRTPPS